MKQTTWHRNLNAKGKNRWSYNPGNGQIQCECVYSKNTGTKQPSGKKFKACLLGAKRSVFAWFKADAVLVNEDVPPVPANAVRIRFNPKLGQTCFQTNDGTRVDFMHEAWGLNNEECWAII